MAEFGLFFDLGSSGNQFGLLRSVKPSIEKSYPYGAKVAFKKLNGDEGACFFTSDRNRAQKCQEEIEAKLEHLKKEIQDDMAEGNVTPGDWRNAHKVAVSGFYYMVDVLQRVKLLDENKHTFTTKELKEASKTFCDQTYSELKLKITMEDKYLRDKCFTTNYTIKLFEWYKVPEDTEILSSRKGADWIHGALMAAYNLQSKIFGPSSLLLCKDIIIEAAELDEADNRLTQCFDDHAGYLTPTWKDIRYNTCTKAKGKGYCAKYGAEMKACCPETCNLCPTACDNQDGTQWNTVSCLCGKFTCNTTTGLYCNIKRPIADLCSYKPSTGSGAFSCGLTFALALVAFSQL